MRERQWSGHPWADSNTAGWSPMSWERSKEPEIESQTCLYKTEGRSLYQLISGPIARGFPPQLVSPRAPPFRGFTWVRTPKPSHSSPSQPSERFLKWEVIRLLNRWLWIDSAPPSGDLQETTTIARSFEEVQAFLKIENFKMTGTLWEGDIFGWWYLRNWVPVEINTGKITNKLSEAGLHQKCLSMLFSL